MENATKMDDGTRGTPILGNLHILGNGAKMQWFKGDSFAPILAMITICQQESEDIPLVFFGIQSP